MLFPTNKTAGRISFVLFLSLWITLASHATEDDFTDRLEDIQYLYQQGDFFTAWQDARTMQRDFRGHPDSSRLAELLRDLNQARREAPEIRFAINNLDTKNPIELDIYRQQILAGGTTSEILLRQAVLEEPPARASEAAVLLRRMQSPQRWEALLARITMSDDPDFLTLLEGELGLAVREFPDQGFGPTLRFLEENDSAKGIGTLPGMVHALLADESIKQAHRTRLNDVLFRSAGMMETDDHQEALFRAVIPLHDDELFQDIFAQLGADGVSLGHRLPPGWLARNIGDIEKPGKTLFERGRFVVHGAGDDIWGSSDNFYFVYKKMSGDLSLTVQMLAQEATATYAKSGVMIRSSLESDSAHAMNVISPEGRRIAFQYRPTRGSSMSSDGVNDYDFPIWLRISREGEEVSADYSTNGEIWENIATHSLSLGEDVYVGLVVSSNKAGVLNESIFKVPLEDLIDSTGL